MNPLPYRNMLAALRLTRAGDLAQATALLQRTLRGAPIAESRTDADLIDSVRPAETPERTARAIPGSHSKVTTISSDVRPHDKPRGQFLPLSFTSAAGTRTYKLYIPSGYQGRPCPLIVMVHGCTQSPDDFAEGTRMNVVADELTYLVAYPEQSASANSSKCWNWFNRRDQQRDYGEPSLVAGITRRIMQEYAVDGKRVYVAGMSAGAAAAAVLAATYPDVYAALGVHSGLVCGLAEDIPSAFAAMKSGGGGASVGALNGLHAQNLRLMPTIVFHGDRDATVHPRNGDRFAAALSTANCEKRIVTGQVHGGRSYTQTTYTDASGQRVFEQWVIHGAGHAWSGGSASGSYTDPLGPDASREIARFFLSHEHPD